MLNSFKQLFEATNQAKEALQAISEIQHENQLSDLIELGYVDQMLSLNEFFPAFQKFLSSNETQINKVGEIATKLEA